MTMEIFGSFKTEEEVIDVVTGLSLRGYWVDHITIFTTENAERLARKTDGNVENVEEDHEGGVLAKVKKKALKISDSDQNFHDELLRFGLSEQQATRYSKEIRDGNILVVGDNKKKMGHDSTPNTDELEVPVIEREDE